MKHLVLGGARSGKSRYAERLANDIYQAGINAKLSAEKKHIRLHYIATATAHDEEMRQRIIHHQMNRGDDWHLVESPLNLAETLLKLEPGSTDTLTPEVKDVVLVDCLTLWLSNIMHDGSVDNELNMLLTTLPRCKNEIIFVSNEVGSGVVPLGQLSRDFVDHAGRLHQSLATLCDRVTLIVAGLPLALK